MSDTPTAMVLAAGMGTRLGVLGKTLPKSLVEINGKPVIEHVLDRLSNAGVRKCVINLFHHGQMVEEKIGSGERFGLKIKYSYEENLLDIAGGIKNALPLLGDKTFIVTNADICSNYDYKKLIEKVDTLDKATCHLVLGNNPDFRPDGDFCLIDGVLYPQAKDALTYIGTALYRPEFFEAVEPKTQASINPLWQQAMALQKISAQHHQGWWVDIGTPERIEEANKLFSS